MLEVKIEFVFDVEPTGEVHRGDGIGLVPR